jgi:hypothetical protein
MRMLQCGQDLPFLPEARSGFLTVDFTLDDFDGHALLKAAVVAWAFEDRALTALSQPAHNAIGTETLFVRPDRVREKTQRRAYRLGRIRSLFSGPLVWSHNLHKHIPRKRRRLKHL